MARYIDADWIYAKVENRYRVSSGIEHRCERDLLDLICEAPDADVVPKREVEEMKIILATYGLQDRIRLAREIFAEIEKIFFEYYEHASTELTFRPSLPVRQTVLFSLNELFGAFAELKKKYTEGNQ